MKTTEELDRQSLWTSVPQEAAVLVAEEERNLCSQIRKRVTIEMTCHCRCMKMSSITSVDLRDRTKEEETANKMEKLINQDVKDH